MRRLGIYVFHDRQGIIDEHILYFMDRFTEIVQELVIVCTDNLPDYERKKFEKYTSHILTEDRGYNLNGYRKGLEYIGWGELKDYDEVILCNSSALGPFYPLSDVLREMEKRDTDFWGILKNYQSDQNPYIQSGGLKFHIPMYFIVIRKQITVTEKFYQFWTELPEIEDYKQELGECEPEFTEFFKRLGFHYDTYINTDVWKDRTSIPDLTMPLELIEKKKCPILTKEIFVWDYDKVLDNTAGMEAKRVYEYLLHNTDYPMESVLDNLLRSYNLAVLYRRFHWNYILDGSTLDGEKPYWLENKRIGLIAYIYYEDLIDYMALYLNKIPEEIDLYIYTNTEEKANKIKHKLRSQSHKSLIISLVPNRGRDMGSLLVGAQEVIPKYDYMGFIHDKKSGHLKPGTAGEAFFHKDMENMIASKNYVYKVLELFEKNPRLGILSPTKPIHGVFYNGIGREWGDNYKLTEKLAKDLELQVPMDKEIPPVAPLGDYFWFRSGALKPLFKKHWKFEDLPEEPVGVDGTLLHAIERIYPFIAQQAGFYSGYIVSLQYMENEYTNWDYTLGKVNNTAYFCWRRWQETEEQLKKKAEEYENSTSWKITAPVRRLGKFLKRKKE